MSCLQNEIHNIDSVRKIENHENTIKWSNQKTINGIAFQLCSYCWSAASASSCCLVAVQLQLAYRLCLLAVQLVVAYWMKYYTIALLSRIAYKTINYCCLNIVLLHNKVHRYCLTKYSNINMRPNRLENGGNCMKNKF